MRLEVTTNIFFIGANYSRLLSALFLFELLVNYSYFGVEITHRTASSYTLLLIRILPVFLEYKQIFVLKLHVFL